MKNISISLLLVCLLIGGYRAITTPPSQNPLVPDGWTKLYIKDLGSIAIPPTMEVQSDRFKQFKNELLGRMEYQDAQLIAQQKGLNDPAAAAPQKYVRVMLYTTIDSPGSHEKLNSSVPTFSSSELATFNAELKQNIENSFAATPQKLLEWFPAKFEKVNGMTCLHQSYKRQLGTQPPVMVNSYLFQNYDRTHEITLSYRIIESDLWKSDLDIVLQSLRITAIR